MKFRLAFGDEHGNWSHEEVITGEYQHVFAWIQGYLKAGRYNLQSIAVVEADE